MLKLTQTKIVIFKWSLLIMFGFASLSFSSKSYCDDEPSNAALETRIAGVEQKQLNVSSELERLGIRYSGLVSISETNAKSAQFLIWFISGFSILLGIAAYLGFQNMRRSAKKSIKRIEDEHARVLKESQKHLEELRKSQEQIEELKKFLTLASQLKEITPEKIGEKISVEVMQQIEVIKDQLNKLKSEDLPKDADIYTRLGGIYIAQKSPGSALQAFSRAIEISPNSYAARSGKAYILGLYPASRQDAINEYKELLRLYPEGVTAIENLLELYILQEAHQSFDELFARVEQSVEKDWKSEDRNILDFHQICSLALRGDIAFEPKLKKMIERISRQNLPYIPKSCTFDAMELLDKKIPGKAAMLKDFESVLWGKIGLDDFIKKYPL